ncbi:hypothetical protein F5Y15DRAFT_23165 [Xylariaceae sp. FL0016]|nr:hypothetical protein F5Y15DRAFT_23165 [Xylariaceae sp. FL0016]
MALNIKHLNSDASFLLTFEPILPEHTEEDVVPQAFTILLDPWITGPSKIFHSKISISTHKQPACISSLAELSQPPDLVIISQHKSDHCNEATLRQLPATGTKTLILAEPAAAKVIRSWKYFDKDKIQTIDKWEDPRSTGKQTVVRIPVPPLVAGGHPGEVTVAYIPQKRDLAGLHSAIGITYRPPPSHNLVKAAQVKVLTPPTTPDAQQQSFPYLAPTPFLTSPTGESFLIPPSPPVSPRSLRAVKSTSTLSTSPIRAGFRPTTPSNKNEPPPSPTRLGRPISLIFSPHGLSYANLASYATSHLVSEAALPLTALLHCMDRINNPWWLGGNICAGVPYGAEIASMLGAKVWVSAHDGDKDVRGLATGMLKTRKWKREEIEGAIDPNLKSDKMNDQEGVVEKIQRAKNGGTEILRMNCGDEVIASALGLLWRSTDEDSECPPTQSAVSHEHPSVAPTRTPPPIPIPNSLRQKDVGKDEKDKRNIDMAALPKIQPDMTPKRIGTYKVLKMKDLIKPSPKLELVPDSSTAPPPTTGLRSPVSEPRAEEAARSAQKSETRAAAPKRVASAERIVRFEIAA